MLAGPGTGDKSLNKQKRSETYYIVFHDADIVLRVKFNEKFPSGAALRFN